MSFPDTKQIGQKSRDGRTGGRSKPAPTLAMHNIVYKVHTPFKPLPMRVFGGRAVQTDRNLPSRDSHGRRAKNNSKSKRTRKKKQKKKRKFSEAPILPHQAPARGPRTLPTGRPRPGHRAPFHCPGGPSQTRLRNPRQGTVAYGYCIVHMYNTYCNNGKAGPAGL